MSTLGDAADVNPLIEFLPHREITWHSGHVCTWIVVRRIMEAVTAVYRQMLQRLWQELEYRIDICHVTKVGNIEHL
jgi:hypothetical protein